MSDDDLDAEDKNRALDEFDQLVAGYGPTETETVAPGEIVNLFGGQATPRDHVDLGVAGSLRQRLQRIKDESPPRPITSYAPAAIALVAGTAIVTLTHRYDGPLIVQILLGITAAAVATALVLRSRITPLERELTAQIRAEQTAHKTITDRLRGTGWVLHADRLIPGTEQRIAFIATGPGGIICLPALPARTPGFRDDGIATFGGEPIAQDWITWRTAEAHRIIQTAIDTPHRDLHFQGPGLWFWLYPLPLTKHDRLPATISNVGTAAPAKAADIIASYPAIFGHQQVQALHHIVEQACKPAPTA